MDSNISTLVQQEVEFQPKDRIHDITPTIALLQAQHLIELWFYHDSWDNFPKSSIGEVLLFFGCYEMPSNI